MVFNFENMHLYFFQNNHPKQLYHAVGHINLYDMNGEICGSILVNAPKCFLDEENKELIALEVGLEVEE